MTSWKRNSKIELEKNENYWDKDSVKLDKVNYSITSGGSSITNGSTTATSSVAIKVNAQSSSNTITIQFMNSSGGTIGSPSTFTGSATKEFALTPGAQYTD